jgi:transcriptional regulator with XRE-family HTH domain
MTQREAALRTGLDNGSISSWETGARVNSLTVANLMRLLVCYHIHPARFMADEYLTAEDWR